MKTILHTYSFDLEKVADREPYHQLSARLRKESGRGHRMHSLPPPGSKRGELVPGPIELEPAHLFENQWNSDQGRVFDWYEEAIFSPYTGKENKLIKRGHYLEITDEMREIRRNTLKCGYTGQQFQAAQGYVFNESQSALGSPYLKEEELHLLRLLPVCEEFRTQRTPLTEAERAHLLPLYIAAQSKKTAADKVKLISKLESDYADTCRKAQIERDGFLWLLNHGVNIDNCIFYNHTEKFSFGWKSPYPESAKSVLLDIITEFPFEYDIK